MKLKYGNGGFQSMHIHLLNGRLFQRLLSKEERVLYRSEQGKILTCLWNSDDGECTATDIALATGLANNTLTTMLKHLVEQNLIKITVNNNDKRKKIIKLTKLGSSQKKISESLSETLDKTFYKDFSQSEIYKFESYQKRILNNLKSAMKEEKNESNSSKESR